MDDKIVKIRKARTCTICGVSFPAGTKMHYHVNTDSGYHTTYKCFQCKDDADAKEVKNFFSDSNEKTSKSKIDFNFSGTPEEYLEIRRRERTKNKP